MKSCVLSIPSVVPVVVLYTEAVHGHGWPQAWPPESNVVLLWLSLHAAPKLQIPWNQLALMFPGLKLSTFVPCTLSKRRYSKLRRNSRLLDEPAATPFYSMIDAVERTGTERSTLKPTTFQTRARSESMFSCQYLATAGCSWECLRGHVSTPGGKVLGFLSTLKVKQCLFCNCFTTSSKSNGFLFAFGLSDVGCNDGDPQEVPRCFRANWSSSSWGTSDTTEDLYHIGEEAARKSLLTCACRMPCVTSQCLQVLLAQGMWLCQRSRPTHIWRITARKHTRNWFRISLMAFLCHLTLTFCMQNSSPMWHMSVFVCFCK